MKNIQPVVLEKYLDAAKFEKISDAVYKDLPGGNFRLALSCELEEGEDGQYPLEDLLDRYYVNCTGYFEETRDGARAFLAFELEGSLCDNEQNRKNILAAAGIIGKRVRNVEDGAYTRLVIEDV